RGQKLFGTVISTCTNPIDRRTNKVFVLNQGGDPYVFYVLREAFTLAPEAIAHVEGNEFDIVADIKNQVRKREKPLEVGDWISWYYSGSQDIAEFRREHKLHQIRCGHPHYQFLLVCVKSPTELCLYNHTFGYIAIDPKEARKLLPNIAFEAWVDVYLDEHKGNKLVVKFDTYERSDHKMQIHVLDTPWTEHYTVDEREWTNDDIIESMIEKVGVVKGKENMEANPDKFFIVPYIDETVLVPGRLFPPPPSIHQPTDIAGLKYRFDAYWHETMEFFVVVGMEKLEDFEPLHTTEANGRILLLESVNQRQDFKSLFHTPKCNFGTMDDPTGALAFHHLSRYAESKCRVYFYEDRHCTFGRFRIEKVEHEKEKKIEKNVRESVKEVRGVRGVVVSSDGRVFSPAHSPLRIFLPRGANIPIGSHVVFTAVVDYDNKTLEATEDSVKVLNDEPPLEYFEFNGRLIFKTTADWTARSDVVCGVTSPHFSILEDPLKVLPSSRRSKVIPNVKVWVAEAGMDERGERRIAQTPFFVVAVNNNKPVFKDAKFMDAHGRDIGGFVKARDGTLTEMEKPNVAKPVAGKFSRPGTAKGATPSIPSAAPSIAPPSSSLTASSVSSSSSPSLLHICGCATGSCAAKKMVIDLMNDRRFTQILHSSGDNKLIEKVVECLF
ncbi:hypothetical protein PMAYCL1PPCAC_31572, partial [Pristionchus mayeri]